MKVSQCLCEMSSENRPCVYCQVALQDTFNKHGTKVRMNGRKRG